MKKKKLLSLIVALSLVLSIASCSSDKGSSNDSADESKAEETTETTLSECEANGHTWQDATCTEAKTCTVCGETEGEALGHTLGEANYQSGPICEVCGEEDGEPLVASFEANGIICNAELDTPCDVPTECYTDTDYETVGSWVVSNYRTFESDDEHEGIEGYEWQEITITAHFTDENAWNYGCHYFSLGLDYYETDDDASDVNSEPELYTVNFNGVEYDQCLREFSNIEGGWVEDYDLQIVDVFRVRVPVGYDGNVYAVVNYTYNDAFEEGTAGVFDALNDNALVYRLG